MRLVLIITVLIFAGCGQFKPSTQSKEENKKRVAEAQTNSVLNALQGKPAWLFTGNACPADVMPETEIEITFLAEGCAENPEECLNKCQANDGNACYALALLLEEKHGLGSAEIPPLYLRACQSGIVSGCTNYAASKTNFDSMDAATTACAANSFEKTCAKDDAWGCNMYGQLLYLGLGRKQNTDEALKTFQKACNVTNADDAACVEARELEQLVRNNANNSSADTNKF